MSTRALIISLAVAVAAAASWGQSPSAHAQGDQRAEAERFFRAGESAYNAGQYLVAAQAFEEAYKLLPVPAIAFSTAQAYRLQYFVDKKPQRIERALELYRTYLAKVPKGARRDDAVASVAELEPILLRLQAEGKVGGATGPDFAATTQLMVTTQVEGATATIDGEKGDAPFIKEVEPGPHKVSVSAEGYFPAEQQATAVQGKFIVAELQLRPKPALVSVRTEAGAQVTVDGRPVGSTPLARPIELPAGKHFVAVTRRGREAWSREVEVGRGEQVELQAPLDTTTRRRAAWWTLGAAGGVYIGAGVTGLLALRSDRDAADLDEKRQREGLTPAELDEYNRLRGERDDRLTMTYALVGVGTVTALASTLMFFLDNPRAEAPPMRMAPEPGNEPAASPISVGPMLGPDGVGLSLGGSF